MVKRLIIVYNKDTQKYANYLLQLISLKDDEDGVVHGLQDGSVEAAVWSEKEYEDNRAKFKSSEKVLFIGNSKFMKLETSNMKTRFERFGMIFGSLGSRAAMYLDGKSIKGSDYKEFLDFAEKYQSDIQDLNVDKIRNINYAVFGLGLFAPFGIPIIAVNALFMKKNADKINDQRFSFLTLYTYFELLRSFMET